MKLYKVQYLPDVEDIAAPVHGVVGSPLLRRHVGAVLGEHLAGLGHLETGVARAALGLLRSDFDL